MPDVALHDTYIVWHWALGAVLALAVVVLILGAAALIKYLFFGRMQRWPSQGFTV